MKTSGVFCDLVPETVEGLLSVRFWPFVRPTDGLASDRQVTSGDRYSSDPVNFQPVACSRDKGQRSASIGSEASAYDLLKTIVVG